MFISNSKYIKVNIFEDLLLGTIFLEVFVPASRKFLKADFNTNQLDWSWASRQPAQQHEGQRKLPFFAIQSE